MSYCRFSSDNWRSDVYVYEDCSGGWSTHVAGRHRVFPPIPAWPHRWTPRLGGELDMTTRRMVYPSKLMAITAAIVYRLLSHWYALHMWSVRMVPLRDIDIPHAGESFNDPTAHDCMLRLMELSSLGFHVPRFAIEALREESEVSI